MNLCAVPLLLLQPVSTDFGQYNSYGDVSGAVRGKDEEPFIVYKCKNVMMFDHFCCFVLRLWM